MSFEATALILAWGAIVVLALATAGLLRQVKAVTMLISGEAAPAVQGPAPGQLLPAEVVSATSGNGAGRGQVLVFMDERCPGCAAIAPQLSRLKDDAGVEIRLLFRGRAGDIVGGQLAVLEGMGAAFERLKVPVTPFAVRVGEDGTIADAAPVGSPEALLGFVEGQHQEGGASG